MLGGMADRNPSFFGPVLPQAEDAPEAFSASEIVKIRARRIEADLVKAHGSAFPATRRFETILPGASTQASAERPQVQSVEQLEGGRVRIVVS